MTARKKRSAYHHGDLERALGDAAVELLAEVGPGFTLRQVAQRVGVTHGAAYRHFEDRDALVAEVARRGFVELLRMLARRAARAGGPRARLEALMAGYIGFGWKHPAQYDVMFGRRLGDSGRFPRLEAAIQEVIGLLQCTVAEFLGTDDRVRSRDFGMAVWSLSHGYTSMVLRRRIHVRSSRAAEQYLRHMARPLLDGAESSAPND